MAAYLAPEGGRVFYVEYRCLNELHDHGVVFNDRFVIRMLYTGDDLNLVPPPHRGGCFLATPDEFIPIQSITTKCPFDCPVCGSSNIEMVLTGPDVHGNNAKKVTVYVGGASV